MGCLLTTHRISFFSLELLLANKYGAISIPEPN